MMEKVIISAGRACGWLILLGQDEVIESSIFPGRATRVFEPKLAGDGASRSNYVIRQHCGQFALQLAPEKKQIEARLEDD